MGETDLRDRLAVDRTLLANERTLLAYVRTALAMAAAGAAVLQFVDGVLAQLGGWLMMGAAALLLPVGAVRFRTVRRTVLNLHRPVD